MSDLPDRLRVARRMQRLTQGQLAQALEVSQPHYSKVERGEVGPSAALATRAERWLEANGRGDLSASDRRAVELARLIQRHGRELARLVGMPPARR